MPFKFDNISSVVIQLRRIALEETQKAMVLLEDQGLNIPSRIHGSRKHLKKLRALLRLSTGALPHSIIFHENAAIRALARRLSSARDSSASLEQVELLINWAAGSSAEEDLISLKTHLQSAQLQAEQSATPTALLRDTALALEDLTSRIVGWPLSGSAWPALAKGFRETYARGRRQLKTANMLRTTEAFHDLRKEVKYHHYQLQLLTPIWELPIQAVRNELEQIATWLGQDHDISILLEHLDSTLTPDIRARLKPWFITHQQTLQKQALHSAARVYAERASTLTERMGRLFTLWTSTE